VMSLVDDIRPEGSSMSSRSLVSYFEASETLLSHLTHVLPDLIYVYDMDQRRNVYTSANSHNLLGYTEQQIEEGGDVLALLLHPEDQPMVVAQRERVLKDQRRDVLSFTVRVRHADGTWRWLHLHETVGAADVEGYGPVRYVFGIARDVSVLHQQEEQLSHLRELLESQPDERVSELYARTIHSDLELQKLFNATSVLFKANNLNDLGAEIARAIVEEFAHVDCGVILVEPDERQLRRLLRAGASQIRPLEPLYIDGPGLVPAAIRGACLIYAPDVQDDPRYMPNDPRVRSELVIPLRGRDSVLGVLDLQSPISDAFDDRVQRILQTYAERAAAAIENVLLTEALRKLADEREQQINIRMEELRQTKEQVEAVLNNSSDAIVFVSGLIQILRTNDAFKSIFGYDAHEVIGRNLCEFLSEAHRAEFEAALLLTIESGTPQHIEIESRSKTSLGLLDKIETNRTLEIGLSPVKAQGMAGVVCNIRDITHRKALEAGLVAALDKQREIADIRSQFSAIVSHEFRTPLATILAAKDVLERHIDKMTPEKRTQYFSQIEQAIIGMTELLDDVLIISRTENSNLRFEPELIRFDQFCHEIVQQLQQSQGQRHTLNLDITGEVRPIAAEPKLMRQVIGNLLGNAIKYSPAGSSIQVDLKYEPDHITLQVSDQGFGIPPEDQPNIFEPFRRASNAERIKGTGLGLTIVRRAVEQHRGHVSFVSQPGSGTTFTVTLPYQPSRDVT